MKSTWDIEHQQPTPADRDAASRNLAFDILRTRYLGSAGDQFGIRTGELAITRAALTSDSFAESVKPGTFPTARSNRWVADLFTRESTTASKLDIPATPEITVAGGMTSEGEEKPEFEPSFDPTVIKIGKAAIWTRVTRETIDDYPGFTNWLRNEFSRQLLSAVDEQILHGDGDAPGIRGLLEWQPAIPVVSTLEEAVATVLEAGYRPTAIVMSGNDYAEYAAADPVNFHGSLYGVPVLASEHCPDGEPVVGEWSLGTFYERRPPTFTISDFDRDNFVQNLVTVRAECRFALSVPTPAAFACVDIEPSPPLQE